MNASLIQDFNRICGPANFIFNAEAKGIEPPTVLRLLPVFKTGSSSIRTTSIWLSPGESNSQSLDPKSSTITSYARRQYTYRFTFLPQKFEVKL